jgi:hypothetical protein
MQKISAILATILLSLAATARADDWTLTDSQLNVSPIQLDAITDQGLTAATTIPWKSVLEISRTVATTPSDPYELFLIGGDHITGAAGGVVGENLVWKNTLLGQFAVPLDRVAAVVRGQDLPANLADSRADDVVQLSNGDTAHGVVSNVCALGVTLQAGDATTTLPWTNVTGVLFSSSPQPPAPTRLYRLTLSDGSAFSVAAVALANDKMTITLSDQTARQIDPGSVATIEQLNGPLSWLTDQTPTENIFKPYFSEWFPARFDQTVDGKPITQKYPGFHHGIGCHSYSRISYALTGQYAAFRTQFAIDSDSSLADVTVRILLDGKPALEKKNVKAGQIYPVTTVPLNGAKTLSLEVDYGQNFATQARFVWLDPALLREIPSPTK